MENSTDVFRGIPPSVMVPRLQEIDAVVADQIDDAGLLGQAAGPDAGGKVFQRFRFASSSAATTATSLPLRHRMMTISRFSATSLNKLDRLARAWVQVT